MSIELYFIFLNKLSDIYGDISFGMIKTRV